MKNSFTIAVTYHNAEARGLNIGDEVFVQIPGLFDIKNDPIFEGSIVKFLRNDPEKRISKGSIGFVEWMHAKGCFRVIFPGLDYCYFPLTIEDDNNFEVMGHKIKDHITPYHNKWMLDPKLEQVFNLQQLEDHLITEKDKDLIAQSVGYSSFKSIVDSSDPEAVREFSVRMANILKIRKNK